MANERPNLPQSLHDAVFHYRRGSEWESQGRYKEALFNFSEVIRLGERDEATRQTAEFPWALLNRGSILHRRGRYESALSDYQRAIAVAPENPWAHDALAWLLATFLSEGNPVQNGRAGLIGDRWSGAGGVISRFIYPHRHRVTAFEFADGKTGLPSPLIDATASWLTSCVGKGTFSEARYGSSSAEIRPWLWGGGRCHTELL
jgi:tetratricopeptide (TPR) repeat protein